MGLLTCLLRLLYVLLLELLGELPVVEWLPADQLAA
jgi:hypothetical protein